jgi:hypothetical protein
LGQELDSFILYDTLLDLESILSRPLVCLIHQWFEGFNYGSGLGHTICTDERANILSVAGNGRQHTRKSQILTIDGIGVSQLFYAEMASVDIPDSTALPI